MKLLKAHGRFLIVLVVLVVILFIANGRFEDQGERIKRSETQARTLLTTNYRALYQDAVKFDGEPATIVGRRIQHDIQNETHVGDARTRMMAFETAPEYTIEEAERHFGSETDELFSYFQRKHLDLVRELGFKRYFIGDAGQRGAFGFNIPDGGERHTRQEIADYLRNLDIVRTVAMAVERTEVQRLTGLQFINERGMESRLGPRGVPVTPAAAGEDPFMSARGLEIQVEASEEALYNFLIDLQRPMKDGLLNRYFAVETFEFEKPDLLNPRTDLINAKILIAIYRVNEESSFPAREEEVRQEDRPSIRGPRDFRR
jgi:hypothetical protein